MLAAWYPLISNMNNQGVGNADLTVSSTPTFVSGLLGGALQGGGAGSWTSSQTASILNNTAMSFCFWVYPDATTGDTGARARFFGNDSPRHYSIFQYPTCNDLHWDWRNNAGSTVLGGVLSGVLPSYKWTHVTFTYQNPTFKIYINGVLKHTASASLDVQSYANSTSVILACSGRKLCDYRVYTHCLSELEVKQISQALLLHYPMTGGGRSGDNLVIDSQNLYTGSSVSTKYIGCRGGTRQLRDDGFYESKCTGAWQGLSTWSNAQNFAVGDIITYSFYAYISGSSHNISFYPMMYNSAGTRDTTTRLPISVDGSSFESGNSRGIGTISSTTPEFHYVTFEWNSAVKSIIDNGGRIELSIQANNGSWTDSYICFFKPKLEKGSKPTPWMPNSADTSYITMGYNDTTEYDVSGYCKNGTRSGSLSWSSDTPRYSVSTHFTASGSQHIVIPTMTLDMTKFSVAAWFKADTAQIWSRILDMGEKTGGAGYALLLTLGQNGTTFTVAGRGPSGATFPDTVIQSINLGQWYHIAVTIDTKTCKAYINGSLVKTFTLNNAFSTATPMVLNYIGKSNWTADKYYDGNISDFRLYATCLTAEDIQKLYNTSASLANNGTLMAYEFTEM